MKHGTIYYSTRTLGSFGWPSITRLPDGNLITVASGFRQHHVCPFGKSVAFYSKDNGITWTAPTIILDAPLDTRDCGVIVYKNNVFVTTFALPKEFYTEGDQVITPETRIMWDAYCSFISDEENAHYTGSLCIKSSNGYNFDEPYKVPVFAPHGMIKLNDGRLFYVGHHLPHKIVGVGYCFSEDGESFSEITDFVLPEDITKQDDFIEFCEPHAVQLKDGKIIVVVRLETKNKLTMMQCESTDNGKTFTPLHELKIPVGDDTHGAPPHLMLHSSGKIILSYGYRKGPYGIRIRLSDDGENWSESKILRDDGYDWDLGYPCSYELDDKKIITVYYQKPQDPKINNNAGILYTIWSLDELL